VFHDLRTQTTKLGMGTIDGPVGIWGRQRPDLGFNVVGQKIHLVVGILQFSLCLFPVRYIPENCYRAHHHPILE